MPDITNPPEPRPKKKLLNNGQAVWLSCNAEWQSGTKVFFYIDGWIIMPNGVYILEDSSQFEVSNGRIV